MVVGRVSPVPLKYIRRIWVTSTLLNSIKRKCAYILEYTSGAVYAGQHTPVRLAIVRNHLFYGNNISNILLKLPQTCFIRVIWNQNSSLDPCLLFWFCVNLGCLPNHISQKKVSNTCILIYGYVHLFSSYGHVLDIPTMTYGLLIIITLSVVSLSIQSFWISVGVKC